MPHELHIPFQGSLTEAQFNLVQRALLPFWTRWYVVVPECFLVFIIFGPGLSSAMAAPLSLWPQLIFAVASWGAIWLITKYGRRRAWHSYQQVHGQVSGVLSAQGLQWRTEISSSNIPWAKVLRSKIAGDIALMYYAPHSAFFLPRNFFESDQHWIDAQALLSQHSKFS